VVDECLKFMSVDGDSSLFMCLMAFRALRPLRILTRFPKLRFLGATVVSSLGMISRAVLFSMVVLFSFGKSQSRVA
jgi:hypothetical protein